MNTTQRACNTYSIDTRGVQNLNLPRLDSCRIVSPYQASFNPSLTYEANLAQQIQPRRVVSGTTDGEVEELLIYDNAVIHIVNGTFVRKYSHLDGSSETILSAFWCRFGSDSSTRWLCIASSSRLTLISSLGDEIPVFVPFRVSGAFPQQTGIQLQAQTDENLLYIEQPVADTVINETSFSNSSVSQQSFEDSFIDAGLTSVLDNDTLMPLPSIYSALQVNVSTVSSNGSTILDTDSGLPSSSILPTLFTLLNPSDTPAPLAVETYSTEEDSVTLELFSQPTEAIVAVLPALPGFVTYDLCTKRVSTHILRTLVDSYSPCPTAAISSDLLAYSQMILERRKPTDTQKSFFLNESLRQPASSSSVGADDSESLAAVLCSSRVHQSDPTPCPLRVEECCFAGEESLLWAFPTSSMIMQVVDKTSSVMVAIFPQPGLSASIATLAYLLTLPPTDGCACKDCARAVSLQNDLEVFKQVLDMATEPVSVPVFTSAACPLHSQIAIGVAMLDRFHSQLFLHSDCSFLSEWANVILTCTSIPPGILAQVPLAHTARPYKLTLRVAAILQGIAHTVYIPYYLNHNLNLISHNNTLPAVFLPLGLASCRVERPAKSPQDAGGALLFHPSNRPWRFPQVIPAVLNEQQLELHLDTKTSISMHCKDANIQFAWKNWVSDSHIYSNVTVLHCPETAGVLNTLSHILPTRMVLQIAMGVHEAHEHLQIQRTIQTETFCLAVQLYYFPLQVDLNVSSPPYTALYAALTPLQQQMTQIPSVQKVFSLLFALNQDCYIMSLLLQSSSEQIPKTFFSLLDTNTYHSQSTQQVLQTLLGLYYQGSFSSILPLSSTGAHRAPKTLVETVTGRLALQTSMAEYPLTSLIHSIRPNYFKASRLLQLLADIATQDQWRVPSKKNNDKDDDDFLGSTFVDARNDTMLIPLSPFGTYKHAVSSNTHTQTEHVSFPALQRAPLLVIVIISETISFSTLEALPSPIPELLLAHMQPVLSLQREPKQLITGISARLSALLRKLLPSLAQFPFLLQVAALPQWRAAHQVHADGTKIAQCLYHVTDQLQEYIEEEHHFEPVHTNAANSLINVTLDIAQSRAVHVTTSKYVCINNILQNNKLSSLQNQTCILPSIKHQHMQLVLQGMIVPGQSLSLLQYDMQVELLQSAGVYCSQYLDTQSTLVDNTHSHTHNVIAPHGKDVQSKFVNMSASFFPRDLRALELVRMVCSSFPAEFSLSEATLSALEAKGSMKEDVMQARLLLIAHRTFTQPLARAFAVFGLDGDVKGAVQIPPIVLGGRNVHSNVIHQLSGSGLEPSLATLLVWPEVHNAVAATVAQPILNSAVQRQQRHEVAVETLLSLQNSVSGYYSLCTVCDAAQQTEAHTALQSLPAREGPTNVASWIKMHSAMYSAPVLAGMILGQTLAGRHVLNNISSLVGLLRQADPVVITAVLFSLAVLYRGSGHFFVWKMLTAHTSHASELVQATAYLGLGLLTMASGSANTIPTLLNYITKRPTEANLRPANSVFLSACAAVAFTSLGKPEALESSKEILQGFLATGTQHALTLNGHGSWEGYNTHKDAGLVLSGYSREVTHTGALLIYAQAHLHSNNDAILDIVKAPSSLVRVQSASVAAYALYPAVTALVQGDCDVNELWIERSIGSFLLSSVQGFRSSDHQARFTAIQKAGFTVTRNTENVFLASHKPVLAQAYLLLQCGSLYAIGLTHAGSHHSQGKVILLYYLECLLVLRLAKTGETPNIDALRTLQGRLIKTNSNNGPVVTCIDHGIDQLCVDATTLECCIGIVMVAVGLLLAGTGDNDAVRLLKVARQGISTKHVMLQSAPLHLSMSFLFLGGGASSFTAKPLTKALLFLGTLPLWPLASTDTSLSHPLLPYVAQLTAQPRFLRTTLSNAPIAVVLKIHILEHGFTTPTVITRTTPCILPPMEIVQKISVEHDQEVYEVDFQKNQSTLHAILIDHVLELPKPSTQTARLDILHQQFTKLTPILSFLSTAPLHVSMPMSKKVHIPYACVATLPLFNDQITAIQTTMSVSEKQALFKLYVPTEDSPVYLRNMQVLYLLTHKQEITPQYQPLLTWSKAFFKFLQIPSLGTIHNSMFSMSDATETNTDIQLTQCAEQITKKQQAISYITLLSHKLHTSINITKFVFTLITGIQDMLQENA